MTNRLPHPHLLAAGSNARKLLENIRHLISDESAQRIEEEIARNGVKLYDLGRHHFNFACRIPRQNWRQRVSRLYYAAYNVSRAVTLVADGGFEMDSSGHKKVSSLPDSFPQRATYEVRLKELREDRNLADYNHEARASDLFHNASVTEDLVSDFFSDARDFLRSRGVL